MHSTCDIYIRSSKAFGIVSAAIVLFQCGCGGGAGSGQQAIQLSTLQGQQLWDAGNAAASLYGQLIATNSRPQTQSRVINSLKATPGVTAAGLTADGHTVWFGMDSG